MDIESIRANIEKMVLLDQKMEDAKEKLKRSKDIDKQIKWLDEHFNLLHEFLEVKKEVKSISVAESVIEITDTDLRRKIQQILSNQKVFKADKSISFLEKRFPDLSDLSYDEIDQLGLDYITSWISTHDIVESLYETKSLILGVLVSDDLRRFVDEARKCLAFQQYNAVYSLCRTMLETAMRDICIRIGQINKPITNSRQFYREYPPHKMINRVSKGRLGQDIHDFYDELSSLIHGYKTIEKSQARETPKKTIGIIQAIYNKNQNSFIANV